MAQNITLLGASYSDVPSVELPKTGGGTASFTDVTDTTATASDVAQGKYFYLASGQKVAGTASGGGGGGGQVATGTFTGDGASGTVNIACDFEPDMIYIVKQAGFASVNYNSCYAFGIVRDSFSYSARNNSGTTTSYANAFASCGFQGLNAGVSMSASYANGVVTAIYTANSCKWANVTYLYTFAKYT